MSRRRLLTGAALATGAAATTLPLVSARAQAEKADASKPGEFIYCLNTSTISGHELSITEEVNIAAKAGYNAIEPWLRKLNGYVAEGGSLKDLGKRIADHGLTVESGIGFLGLSRGAERGDNQSCGKPQHCKAYRSWAPAFASA